MEGNKDDVVKNLVLGDDKLNLTNMKNLRKLGHIKEAIQIGETLLQYELKRNGYRDKDCLRTCMILASCYHDNGDFKKSISLLEEIIPFMTEVYGSGHNMLGICYSNIAVCYNVLNQFELSMDWMERFGNLLKQHSENKPSKEYAIFLHNKAMILNNKGTYESKSQALSNLYEAKRVASEVCPDSEILVKIISCLGYVLKEVGRMEESTKCFEEGLDIAKRVLGTEHVSYGSILLGLGCCLRSRGLKKGFEVLDEARSVLTKNAHLCPNTLLVEALSLAGDLEVIKDNWSEAEKHYDEALQKTTENDSRVKLLMLKKLSVQCERTLQISKKLLDCKEIATKYWKQVQEWVRSNVGGNTEDVFFMIGAGIFLARSLLLGPAKKAFEEAQDLAETSFGNKHFLVGWCLFQKGKVAFLMDQLEEGEKLFEDAREIFDGCDVREKVSFLISKGEVLLNYYPEDGIKHLRDALELARASNLHVSGMEDAQNILFQHWCGCEDFKSIREILGAEFEKKALARTSSANNMEIFVGRWSCKNDDCLFSFKNFKKSKGNILKSMENGDNELLLEVEFEVNTYVRSIEIHTLYPCKVAVFVNRRNMDWFDLDDCSPDTDFLAKGNYKHDFKALTTRFLTIHIDGKDSGKQVEISKLTLIGR